MAEALQEYVNSRGVTLRVDREHGVLRGVKLIGLESENGRRYAESALEQAASLYEESKVNVNHPKAGPLSPRDYQDRLGVIRGVELRTGQGLFGDLHFNPKHPLAEQLVWDAEHNPRNVGFSHNVLAKLTHENEIATVEEITRVVSVDLVADPATTSGLFEQVAGSDDTSLCGGHKIPWDVLTLDTLKLHRPDLLGEVEAMEVQRLRTLLEQTQATSALLCRKQLVGELLRKHRLPAPEDGANQTSEAEQIVGKAFLETLYSAEEKDLDRLISERAALVRSAFEWQTQNRKSHQPLSREQTAVFQDELSENESSDSFARALGIRHR